MCGIAGIYSRQISIDEKHAAMRSMSAVMSHRGPDGSGTYVDEDCCLVATRLAIVDRKSNCHLPRNETGSVVTACNGEIYNYASLRTRMCDHHQFRTKTDTEVIVHAYEEYGIDALNSLCGDFALAVYDSARRTCILARDRMGVKPIYYAAIPGGIVFASEIRAILSVFPDLSVVEPTSVYHYLTFRFVPGPRTVFRGIHKVMPGHWLSVDSSGMSGPTQYWDLCLSCTADLDDAHLVDSGRVILERAVLERIPGEVECGILLSGGLDSSVITAIAASNTGKKLNTYSVMYEGSTEAESISEHGMSRLVSGILGTEHHEMSVSARMFRDSAERTVRHMEEPVADPPSVLLGLICALAREDVTVLLSGEGADELLAGYFIYPEILESGHIYSGMGRLLVDEEKHRLLSKEFLDQVGEAESRVPDAYDKTRVETWDLLHQMLYLDCKFWLVDDLLLKADKMSMMSSVEIRVPYLDHRFVDFCFSTPVDAKLRGGVRKYLLRRIADHYLPASVVGQAKKGFPLPLGTWLRDDLKEWTNDLLSSLSKRSFVNATCLKDLRAGYFDGPPSSLLDHVVWSLVVLELFWRGLASRS